MDSTAFNYDDTACYDNGTCIAVVLGCTDPTAFNFDLDLDPNTDDGSCIPVLEGCTSIEAYNYDSSANTDDGTCLYEGCTDNLYLDYYTQGFVANIDNGTCLTLAVFGCMLEQFANYDPNANVDASQDPSLESETCYHIFGCTDAIACNYDASASLDDNTCFYLEDMSINLEGVYYDCDGSCLEDADSDGICDSLEIVGCQDDSADNYNFEATDSGDCIFYGCTDSMACNFDQDANTDNNSCWYPMELYLTCEGECINDTDFDGVCDEAEIFGCTDLNASNYTLEATEEDNTCEYSCEYLISEESYVNSGFDDTFSNYYCYQYVWVYGFYTLEEAIANQYACE